MDFADLIETSFNILDENLGRLPKDIPLNFIISEEEEETIKD